MMQGKFSRKIALALCLCMLISCVPTMPAMAEASTEHLVTYQLDDGSVYATQPVADEGTIGEVPADPSKEGFNFLRWYQGTDSGTAFDFTQPITADLTLVAYFEAVPVEPDDTVYVTVTFEDGFNGAVIGEPITIEQGQGVTAPTPPTHAGYQFKEWDTAFTSVQSDITVTATYEQLHQYSVTINYYFADSTRIAASPYVSWLPAGDNIDITVDSPDVVGFTPSQASVTVQVNEISADVAYTVYYSGSADTAYQIIHQYQNLAGDYVTDGSLTQNLMGTTGDWVSATATDRAGFTSPSTLPGAYIAADGSTVLQVRYTRNSYTLSFVTNGSYIRPEVLMFEEATTLQTPTRPGYTFLGWNTSENGTGTSYAADAPYAMPAGDTTLYAQWQTATVGYTVVYWQENADDIGYSYKEKADKTGLAGAAATYDTKSYTGFSLNTSMTNAAAVTISGDGTTIRNVYYSRNTYTLTFKNKWGTTPLNKTFTGIKYGAYVKPQWILMTTNSTEGNFEGYNWYISYTSSISYSEAPAMPDHNLTLYGEKGTGYYYRVKYVEKGTTTQIHDPYDLQRTGRIYLTQEDQIAIPGFTYHSWVDFKTGMYGNGSGTEGDPYYATLSYTRNIYSISFHTNGGTTSVPNVSSVLYEASISGYAPADYVVGTTINLYGNVFTGWYDNEACVGTPFVFTGATMPAHNLLLYAGWRAPTYIVTFNPNNNEANVDKTYSKGQALNENLPAQPTKTGYTFAGWSLGGAPVNVSATRVYESMLLTAVWQPKTDLNCPVLHEYASTGEVFDSSSIVGQTTGTTVTAYAQAFEQSGVWYFPDAVSKSCLLTGDPAQDQIVFIYTAQNVVPYTVYYAAADSGDADFAQAAQAAGATTAHKSAAAQFITEDFASIPGYTPDAYQKKLELSNNPSANVITFLYTKNPNVQYTIKYWKQDLDGQNYTLADEVADNGPIGITVTAPEKSYTGFTRVTQSSNTLKLTSNPASNVLNIYYKRIPITVNFAVNDSAMGSLIGIVHNTVRYGTPWSAITEPTTSAKVGYMFTGWDQEFPTSDTPLTQNLTFIANFAKDDAAWYSVTYYANDTDATGSMAPATDLVKNSAYTIQESGFTLANHDFASWNTQANGNGITYGPSSKITMTANVTLYAQWTEHGKITVSYDRNGAATGTDIDPQTKYVGNSFTAAANPYIYPGYEFAGWNTAANGSGTGYDPGNTFTPDENTVLYAQWDKIDALWHTVTYSGNGATFGTAPVDSGEYLEDSPVTVLDNTGSLVKTGYTFLGWSTNPNATAAQYTAGGSFAMGNENVTLYAVWQSNEHTVTYYVDGIQKYLDNYNYGDSITKRADESLAGHTFSGWCVDAACTIPWTPFTMPDVNVSVYGEFTANIHKITYYVDGVVDFEDPAVAYGAPIMERALPTEDGLIYSAWQWNTADHTAPATMPDEDMAAYTTSTRIECDYNFYDENGTTDLGHGTLYYGDPLTPPSDPVKPSDNTYDYPFAGWALATDSDVVTVPATITEDVTYYAVYTPTYINYTVAFKDYDSTPIQSSDYHYGDALSAPADPSRASDSTYTYTFAGWALATDSDVVTVPATATDSVTYYAVYTPSYINYTVAFKDYDSTLITSSDYHYGATLSAPADPSRASDSNYTYTFAGWATTQGGTVVAVPATATENVTYYAVYTPAYINYTVAFKDYDSTPIQSSDYHYGDALSAPTNPSRASDSTYSYTFAGWALAPDGNVVTVPATATENVTYYAVYTPSYINYTVAFKDYDSTPITSSDYHYGDALSTPADPSRPDSGSADGDKTYTFLGWAESASGPVVTLPSSVTAGATYYAVYDEDTYVTVTAYSASRAYDGTALNADYNIAGLLAGDTVTDITYNTSILSITEPDTLNYAPTAATISRGSLDVTDEYAIRYAAGTLTITKKDVTITMQSASKYLDELDPTFDGDVTGLVNANDLGTVTFYRTNAGVEDLGTYENVLRAQYTDNACYNVTVIPADFTIMKRGDLALSLAGYQQFYDGSTHYPSQVDAVSGGSPVTDATIEFRSVPEGSSGDYAAAGTWYAYTSASMAATHMSDSGYYQVRAKCDGYVPADGTNPDGSSWTYGTIAMTVLPVLVTVKADDATKPYDGTLLTKDTYQVVSGSFVGEEGFSGVDVDGGQLFVGSSTNLIASYTLKDNTTAGDYVILKAPGTLTITPAGIAITVNGASNSWTYDGLGHNDEQFSHSGTLAAGDSIVATVSADIPGNAIVNAGTCSNLITGSVQVLHDNGNGTTTDVTENYVITPMAGVLTITQKAVTLTVNDASKTWDEADPAGYNGVQVTGLVSDTDLNPIAVIRAGAGIDEDPGDYPEALSATYTDLYGNYNVSIVKGTFTILKKTGMLVSATDITVAYDGKDHGVTPTCNVEGATIKYWDGSAYTLSESPVERHWTDGPVTVKFQATCFGYEPAEGQATITIDKRAITLTADSATAVWYYGITLTKHSYTLSTGSLASSVGGVNDVIADYAIPSSISVIGWTDNVITPGSVRITHTESDITTDVTSSYAITLLPGTLTLTDPGPGGPETTPTPTPYYPTPTPYRPRTTPTPGVSATPTPTATPTPVGPLTTAQPTPSEPVQAATTENVQPEPVPLASAKAWALLNLILSILTVLASLLLIIFTLGKKHKGEQAEKGEAIEASNDTNEVKKKKFWRWFSLVPAIGSVIVFILTENMSLPMAWVDKWTILMVVIAIIQALVAIFSRKRKKQIRDDEDKAMPSNA